MTNYKVNAERKTVTVDMAKLTATEMEIVKVYVAAVYIIKEKKSGVKYDDMKKALKNNAEALKELDKKIKAKENYMIIKKWYSDIIKSNKQ